MDDISVPSNSYLSITDALSHLRSTSSSAYRAPDALERDVWARIRRYPEAMKTHTQKAAAYLPKEVVRCLRARPDLVQRAVEGFYTRDPAQLRVSPFSQEIGLVLMKCLCLACIESHALLSKSGEHSPFCCSADQNGVRSTSGTSLPSSKGIRSRVASIGITC